MLKRAERAARGSDWRERLAGWRVAGGSLAAYARAHGWKADDAYRWRRILRREAARTEPVPPRFARIAVRAEAVIEARRATPVRMRLALANGRHAEFEIADAGELVAIVCALECAA
ncbi:MAG: hypothetical protein V9E93_18355 [Steroidobacteraceae bacterium]|nr:hypothetical protein [Pseudomonadota bacterium]MBP6106666.1 hypothetical protein [Steroidobacteraceae bacterium]MBP7013257.1 hypothetical protein [Steroidobacteraceae bacterium]